MKNNLFTLLLVITFSSINVFSQENLRNFQNKEYVKINNEWNVLNVFDLQHYPIESNLVTIKFKQNASEEAIQNYILQNNLTLIRKAITGWYDFQTNGVTDIFQKSTQLIGTSSSIVDNLEIPTKGSYNIIPNDTNQASQWHLNKINAYGAWNIEKGKPNIKVAILDSGTNWIHEDLGLGTDSYQNINLNNGEDAWSNPNNPATGNGIDDDGNGLIDDWKGWNFDLNNNNSQGIYYHGTWVAGIVSAKTNNNKGIAGISGGWNNEGSKLLICNVGQNFPNGSVIDDAILYAGQMGVKVIQLSLTVAPSTAINDAITFAYNTYGLIIVCASGNNSSSSGVSYPASNSLVFAVGATTQNDLRASFSNHGENIFVSAPGLGIVSTGIAGGYTCTGSTCPDGTSFAAPIVSGIIALMYSVNPCLTQAQVKQILKVTSEKVGGYNYNWNSTDLGHSKELGYGRVNAFLAVQMAQSIGLADLDLYVKDSQDDIGVEPNTVTQYMWISDNIWVRNSNDNGLVHENPDYSANGNPNYVKVRVINKKCVASTGNEQLKLYWAKASTGLSWPNPWNGGVLYDANNPNSASMGNLVGTLNIPILQAGQEAILTFPWQVPNPANYGNDGDQWHFCLLSRIVDTNDTMTIPETGDLNANVRNNNNIAWKNVTVVDILPNNIVNPGGVVAVGNPFNQTKTFFLELEIADLETGKPIYQEAEVSIKMNDVLYQAWKRGGNESQFLDQTLEEKRKIVKGNHVILDNIVFNANETGTLRLDFNFLTKELTDKTNYAYHVIQKDAETGQIIGGETFIINKNPRPIFEAEAPDKEVDLNQAITISAKDINEPAIYNWYDNEGNLIYQGKDLQIANAISEKFKLEVISTVDGFKDYTEVEVKLKPSTLENIMPNPATNNVLVSYKLNGVNSAYLMVIGYYGSNGTSNNYILNVNSNETNLNVSDYPSGFYTVALVVNGEIVDAKTLIKQ